MTSLLELNFVKIKTTQNKYIENILNSNGKFYAIAKIWWKAHIDERLSLAELC